MAVALKRTLVDRRSSFKTCDAPLRLCVEKNHGVQNCEGRSQVCALLFVFGITLRTHRLQRFGLSPAVCILGRNALHAGGPTPSSGARVVCGSGVRGLVLRRTREGSTKRAFSYSASLSETKLLDGMCVRPGMARHRVKKAARSAAD